MESQTLPTKEAGPASQPQAGLPVLREPLAVFPGTLTASLLAAGPRGLRQLRASRSRLCRLVRGTTPGSTRPLPERDPHAEPPAKPILLLMPRWSHRKQPHLQVSQGELGTNTSLLLCSGRETVGGRCLKRLNSPGRAARSPQPEASAFLFSVIEGSWQMSLHACFYLLVNPHFVGTFSLGSGHLLRLPSTDKHAPKS